MKNRYSITTLLLILLNFVNISCGSDQDESTTPKVSTPLPDSVLQVLILVLARQQYQVM